MANPLKAGTLDDFAASLAEYIDTAMHNEWHAVKGVPLPDEAPGAQDRKILFAAVAQGVLHFLFDHLGDLVTTDDSGDGGATTHHHAMNFTANTFRDPS